MSAIKGESCDLITDLRPTETTSMLLRHSKLVHSGPWTQVQIKFLIFGCVRSRQVHALDQTHPHRLQGTPHARESTAATCGGTMHANGLPGWLTGTSAGDMYAPWAICWQPSSS